MRFEGQIVEQFERISLTGFNYVRESLLDGSPFHITIKELSQFAEIDILESQALLNALSIAGILTREVRFNCSLCENLGLSSVDYCQFCDRQMTDGEIVEEEIFVRNGIRTRDLSWVVLIHGMNTRGKWLPIINWYQAINTARSIPIYQHDYGRVIIHPFFPRTRKLLRNDLITGIQKHQSEVQDYGELPDVIAHSFGTWLILDALLKDKNLRVGKIILLGSIVNPAFDWSLIDGQYEEILIHRFQKDHVVGLLKSKIILSLLGSQPFRWVNIGASGVSGFVNKTVAEEVALEWGHSTAFEPQNVEKTFKEIWIPFLKSPN